MSYNLSIALFLSFILFENHQIGVITQMISFTLNKQENKRFKGKILARTTVTTMQQCLQHCLQDCRCLSFDMCSSSTECRLSTNTDLQINRNLLLPSKGCSHFEFKQENNQQCDHSCMSAVNCCLISNPCKNGGKCSPSNNNKERFHCACPKRFTGKNCQRCVIGYTGNLCEQKIMSCRGYANGKRVLDEYTIFDSRGARYHVYCDFDLESNMTWTLIQSYSLTHMGNFGKRSAFFNDLPILQESSWNPYRLSKFQMQSIQDDSTKWRITCDRQRNEKVNYRDYVRGLKSEVDILTFQNQGECRRVEYINVRGYNCSNCSALFFQTTYFPFHFDSRSSVKSSPPKLCDFKAHDAKECTTSENQTVGEDNFGLYECINKEHRCTATNDSNTQIWLGD